MMVGCPRFGIIGQYCKKKSGELWAHPYKRTTALLPVAVGSRRVRLGPCLETLLRNWHSCWTPWSVFRNSNDGRLVLSLSGSL